MRFPFLVCLMMLTIAPLLLCPVVLHAQTEQPGFKMQTGKQPRASEAGQLAAILICACSSSCRTGVEPSTPCRCWTICLDSRRRLHIICFLFGKNCKT